jgi:hypothetical protein
MTVARHARRARGDRLFAALPRRPRGRSLVQRLHGSAAMRPPRTSRFLPTLVLLTFSLATAAGCDDGGPDDAARQSGDPLDPSYDECAERRWYSDGVCDQSCAEPDPDCGDDACMDACADVCDATWSGAPTPDLPAGCSEASCDCGDPPLECPDVCEAECTGAALPEVPEGCPVYTCDCDEVLPDPAEDEASLTLLRADVERCAARPPTAAARVAIEAADRREAARALASATSRRRTIDIVFHVIRSGSTGDVPRRRLIRQISVMNSSYKRTPFQFRMTAITRHNNRRWFAMKIDSADETRAKNSLHSGRLSTLNVYTTGTSSALGWAVFPWEASRMGKQDGIVLNHTTLPGGKKPYDLGDTLVHEAGHWLGLYHTFEGGCADKDGLADTPAEKSQAFGCPVGRDTCKSDRGHDPIRNFMDYTDDSCMNQFTGGQRGRMGRLTGRYRPVGVTREGNDGCGDGLCSGDENDSTCPDDCGCAATPDCGGVAPFGCYCDPDCAANGDCCSDAATCT